MEDATVARIRHNNNVFRDANERIRAAAEDYDHQLERIPFLCECPVESCVELVRMTVEEYEAVRENASHFMTAVGHEAAEKPVADVVARKNGYVIVEKT